MCVAELIKHKVTNPQASSRFRVPLGAIILYQQRSRFTAIQWWPCIYTQVLPPPDPYGNKIEASQRNNIHPHPLTTEKHNYIVLTSPKGWFGLFTSITVALCQISLAFFAITGLPGPIFLQYNSKLLNNPNVIKIKMWLDLYQIQYTIYKVTFFAITRLPEPIFL